MKRTVFGLLLLVSCLLLLSSQAEEWELGIQTCTAILDRIRAHHPVPPDETTLVHASLQGLLSRLDPHSYFLDPDAYRSMFEDHRGNYFGIGTRIRHIDGRLTVISPIEGTPAFQLGILPGDIITAIDGMPTRDLSVDEAMKRLRGREGTRVTISVERSGEASPLTFDIPRAAIPLSSLTHVLTEPGHPEIGYIGLRTFGGGTPSEFRRALESLVTREGINRLIIDLRWNTGGSLAAAIELSDFFLSPGRPIVTLRGRAMERGFTSRNDPLWPKMNVVILINSFSASASEILAAALQEHGRATVIGSRSWGKGLVETVFNLPGSRGVALTTARYYTPRGRCLQREYGGAENPYGYRIPADYNTNRSIAGGVIPDILVEDGRYSRTVRDLINRGAFFRFSRHLLDSGFRVTRDLQVDDHLVRRFREFLDSRQMETSRTPHVESELRREIARALQTSAFSESAGFRVFLTHDPVNRAAVDHLDGITPIKEPRQ